MSTNSLTYTADRAEHLASGYQRVVERIRKILAVPAPPRVKRCNW